jgi:hypothetical protein
MCFQQLDSAGRGTGVQLWDRVSGIGQETVIFGGMVNMVCSMERIGLARRASAGRQSAMNHARFDGSAGGFFARQGPRLWSAAHRPDSDHDGLSEGGGCAAVPIRTALMVSDDDSFPAPGRVRCSIRPVERRTEIYGQAFPREGHAGQVELHYYHLWRRDCGTLSHDLDAEHVSGLVARDDESKWKALYWYAAAHEGTVCDASQIARAAAVDGELHGPVVWISRGKHASFLNEAICAHGCGGDKCRAMAPLSSAAPVNLGERSSAMNGATWAGSAQWPLADKMSRNDVTDARIARVDRLPATSIAWANSEKHPMQAVIHGGNNAIVGASAGMRATDMSLDTASANTGEALDAASGNTGEGWRDRRGG